MKRQFVTYEIALKLKELGFDEEVIATFDTDDNNELKIFAFSIPNKGIFEEGFKKGWCIKAPLWQQAIDWFESKNIQILITPKKSRSLKHNTLYLFTILNNFEDCGNTNIMIPSTMYDKYKTYEQAILKAIELIKINNNENK